MSTRVPRLAWRAGLAATALLSGTWLYADPTFTPAGDYTLVVKVRGVSGTGTLSVSPGSNGFTVSRSSTVGGTSTTLAGTGVLGGRTLRVTFPVTADMASRLDLTPGNGQPKPITATYLFDGKGKFYGRVSNPGKIGGWSSASDTGSKGSTSALTIVRPATGGSFFVGQEVDVVTNPPGATWEAAGPAQRTSAGKLQFTGIGDVNVIAKKGTDKSDPSKLRVVGLEVIEIEVQNSIPMDDASAPQLQRQLGATTLTKKEPAAIYMNQPLSLRVTVQGGGDLAQPFRARLVGTAKDLKLAGDVVLDKLASGQVVVLTSDKPVSQKVAVNSLDLAWTVEAAGKTVPGGPTTNLRVYTSYKAPLQNVNGPSSRFTKLHFEKACTWANGASKNIGNGSDSIGWNTDNYMRHYVHPKDYKKPVEVPEYAPGVPAPLNYGDLSGSWSVSSSGERGVSSLYYPPLEPHKDYEHYENYRMNFGWHVLENPTHVGGRCNQQASLIADIFGTVGIKAGVFYLERTAVGKRTGRPMRNYFYAKGGSGPWNFHGVASGIMEDGNEWLYDGCFSSPPNRLNGVRSWATAPGGPFLEKWGPWYYEDAGGQVPENDIPDKSKWRGIQ
ncbi:MAG: hypothetical protein HYZ53_28280 [Planctomycetes bacterium]|nr:hypothetical protein [Planctomycetota bacterium]